MGNKIKPFCDLKKVRNSRSLTQEKLAERLGVRSASIAMLENNKRGASIELAIRLCEVLCCRFEELYPPRKLVNHPSEELENGDKQLLVV